MNLQLGIKNNKLQISYQLIQVFMVGLTIGMMRIVVPGLAENEFGVMANQFLLLSSFVVVFGIIKALMNLFAGHWSDQYGRKKILIIGWIFALPIPFLILYAENWYWVIAATLFLGVNQGLCWSMTINSKLDLATLDQKGLINGMNEFFGYVAVAVAGVITAYLVDITGAKMGLFIFGNIVIVLAILLCIFFVKETMPWAKLHHNIKTEEFGLLSLFLQASWTDKKLLSLNQAGLIEKFADAIVWIFFPLFFISKGFNLLESSVIISIYGIVWGSSQLVTGWLSDKIGRKTLIVYGMWLCSFGLLIIPFTNSLLFWSIESAIIGLGMAMLYPTLGAAVADFSPVDKRGSLLGIYRFWRDFGYALAALSMGLFAQYTQQVDTTFYLASIVMFLSGLYVFIIIPKDLCINRND